MHPLVDIDLLELSLQKYERLLRQRLHPLNKRIFTSLFNIYVHLYFCYFLRVYVVKSLHMYVCMYMLNHYPLNVVDQEKSGERKSRSRSR